MLAAGGPWSRSAEGSAGDVHAVVYLHGILGAVTDAAWRNQLYYKRRKQVPPANVQELSGAVMRHKAQMGGSHA